MWVSAVWAVARSIDDHLRVQRLDAHGRTARRTDEQTDGRVHNKIEFRPSGAGGARVSGLARRRTAVRSSLSGPKLPAAGLQFTPDQTKRFDSWGPSQGAKFTKYTPLMIDKHGNTPLDNSNFIANIS